MHPPMCSDENEKTLPISVLDVVLLVSLALSLAVNLLQGRRLERLPNERYKAFKLGVTHSAAYLIGRIRDDGYQGHGTDGPSFYAYDYLHSTAQSVVAEETTYGRYRDAQEVLAMIDQSPRRHWIRRDSGSELDALILAQYERHMKYHDMKNRPPGADTGGAV